MERDHFFTVSTLQKNPENSEKISARQVEKSNASGYNIFDMRRFIAQSGIAVVSDKRIWAEQDFYPCACADLE
ncbi:MAG: hypothetical protein PUC57_02775 [Oscillospiraceae bacterium]|nr:hypothetical protein [Oscillospiraceae bacterium]